MIEQFDLSRLRSMMSIVGGDAGAIAVLGGGLLEVFLSLRSHAERACPAEEAWHNVVGCWEPIEIDYINARCTGAIDD